MRERKTILYLRTDIYHEELVAGGSVSHTIGVIKGFKQLGYSIIAGSSVMHNQLHQLVDELIPLYNPRFLCFLRWKLNCLISNIFFTLQLLIKLKNKKIDYIYQRYGVLNCVGLLISKIKKVPLVLEYNGSEYWVAQNWCHSRIMQLLWLIKKIELFNLRRAHIITVVSDVLKIELIARTIDPRKIIVVPNGVDTELFDPQKLQAARSQMRAELNIPADGCVVGFIGTFGQWHGINILQEVITSITRLRKNVWFLLIGDGPLLDSLKDSLRNIDNRVIFTGLIKPTCAPAYLAACDIFLAPTQHNKDGSRFFGSPTKLFEYMSMAKPIVASDLEQLAEIIHPAIKVHDPFIIDWHDKIGLLAQSDKPQEFVRAIEMILETDSNKRSVIGVNARNKIEKSYTWFNHVQKIDLFIKGGSWR